MPVVTAPGRGPAASDLAVATRTAAAGCPRSSSCFLIQPKRQTRTEQWSQRRAERARAGVALGGAGRGALISRGARSRSRRDTATPPARRWPGTLDAVTPAQPAAPAINYRVSSAEEANAD